MCSTATLSPIVIASVWSWVTYKVATPTRRWMREISARIWTRSLASRLESGSSIKKHRRLADDGASHGDALALAAGELARLGVEVVAQAQQLAASRTFVLISCLGNLRSLRAKPMFWATVMCGYRA